MMKNFIFLFLFCVSFSYAQPVDSTLEELSSKEELFISNNFTNYESSSYPTLKTSRLSGKIELAGLALLNRSAVFVLEFEKRILRSRFMWFFQIGGGGYMTHESSSLLSGLPYASTHVGLRYKFKPGLTFSLATGTRTFQLDLWNMASVGWDIMDKVHIEIGVASILAFPAAFVFSIGTPIIQW